jgi:hypothetical protein
MLLPTYKLSYAKLQCFPTYRQYSWLVLHKKKKTPKSYIFKRSVITQNFKTHIMCHVYYSHLRSSYGCRVGIPDGRKLKQHKGEITSDMKFGPSSKKIHQLMQKILYE